MRKKYPIYHLAFFVIFLFLTSCHPTIDSFCRDRDQSDVSYGISKVEKYSKYCLNNLTIKPLFGRAKIPKTLGVTDFKDLRPKSERRNNLDTFNQATWCILYPIIGQAYLYYKKTYTPYSIEQPIGNLDEDVPRYLGYYIKKANIFDKAVRIPDEKHLQNQDKPDLMLLGTINRFWGTWRTGGLLSGERLISRNIVIHKWELKECYGIVSLDLKIVDFSSKKTIWSDSFYVKKVCHNLFEEKQYTTNNALALIAFKKAIINIVEELKLFASNYKEKDLINNSKSEHQGSEKSGI